MSPCWSPSSFAIAGQRAGEERDVSDWAKNNECYFAAARSAIGLFYGRRLAH